MNKSWMRTDEREDVLSSLKLFNDALLKVELDTSYWKWAIISLHSATQSMMAFHLGLGNDLLVMSQEDAEAWLHAHNNETDYPETKMDSFLNLYKKIKKHQILGYKFTPSGQEGSSIKKLNTLRNEFIHFMPKGWSVEILHMLEISIDCINIVKRLGSGEPHSRWEDEKQAESFNQLIEEAEYRLCENKNH